MSDIPSDLYREILLHLPAESLFRFRAVCRGWCLIIDDPSFIKSHTINQHSSNCSLLIRDFIFHRLYSLPLHSLTHHQQTVDLTRIKNLVRRGVPSLRGLPTTSCHGLILISHFNFTKDWVIWNPLTRDCRRLSEPDIHIEIPLEGVGLGYDYATDDYKVVRIDEAYCDGEFVYRTRVYSLESGTWKMIGDCRRDSMLWRSLGVYLKGALYWICETVIMALDLATEVYRLLPLPPLSGELDEPLSCMYLDALDGCLFVSYYYTSKRCDELMEEVDEWLEVWIMKDETSWIKLVSLFEEEDGVGGNGLTILRPVAYLKSRGEVILQHNTHFYCFDSRKNSKKKVTIHGLPQCFGCQDFQGSLVRLVDGSAGVKRNKKRSQRLKLSVTVDNL